MSENTSTKEGPPSPLPCSVSIIIVNYNGGDLVHRCVASIESYPPSLAYEVLIIDNNSSDNSAEPLSEFRHTTVIVNNENVGLARAFNHGLRVANGDLVVALDNDTIMSPDSLNQLLKVFDNDPHIGLAGSRVLNPDLTPQMTARRRPHAINAIFGRRSLVTRLFPDNPISKRYLLESDAAVTTPYDVDWVSTAALAVRRKVVDTVGGLDEDFFVYWVDADWCERIKNAGWRIVSVPKSQIIHDENLKANRRNKKSTRMVLDFHDGAYRYYSKNHCAGFLSLKRPVAYLALKTRAYMILFWDEIVWRCNKSRTNDNGLTR